MISCSSTLHQLVILANFFKSLHGLKSDFFLQKHSQRISDYSNAVEAFVLETNGQSFELILQAETQNKQTFESIDEVFTETLKNISSFIHTLSINDLSDKKSLKNIIFLDGYTSFLKLYPYLENHDKTQVGIYIFVLFLKPGSDYYKIMKNIMKKMYERNLFKIVVLVQTADNIMEFYTFDPYTKTHCGKVIPVRLNRIRNGRLEVPLKFPIKRCQNLYKCSIKVFSWNIPPFMLFGKEATLEKNTLNFTGFEGEILKIVAEKLNFSIKLMTDPNHLWGEVYSKENMTGPFELLRNRTADIHLGYVVHDKNRVLVFEFSHSYYISNFIAIVRRYSFIDSYFWIFEPFQVETWLILLLCLIVLLLFMFKYTPQKDRILSCLTILAQFLGIPFRIDFKSSKFYFIFSVLGICFLVLRSAYMGKIYSSFNIKHLREPPATISDLLIQNYTIYTVRPFVDSVSGRSAPRNAPQGSTGAELFDMLQNTALNEKAGALVSQARLIHFVLGKKRHEIFEPISQPVSRHQFCAYFTAGSCISNSFNKIVLSLLSSGIVDKWVSHFNADSRSFEQFRRNMQKFKQPTPLSMETLGLIFMLFGVGLAITLFVFICEIIYGHFLRRK